ncbi:MAG: ribosome maturation factor RimP [Actinobacteria bacterium]|nr:ribosome maturation factor RimP [Actinomycetota bacterium]
MTAQSANSRSPGAGLPLEPLVREAVQRAGYDLECLEVVAAGRRHLVRVVVDSDSGVGLDAIAMVSRAVSAELDQCDGLLAGPYTLEVTSPGVDRPLTAPRHWRRNRLRLVRATLREGGEIVGRVGDCDSTAVTLLVSGELRQVAFAELDRAVVEIEFRPPPAEELAVLAGHDQGSRDGTEEER